MTAGQPEFAPLVSLVVPAYNEEDNIRRGALEQAASYLAHQQYASELIVVDDGSFDATAALVAEVARRCPHVRLLSIEHSGKARAVTAGVLAATGAYVIFSDMDQSTPVRFVAEALRELQAGSDLVIGSRLMKGAARQGEPPLRRVQGRLFALLVRFLLLPDISDSQCGFKGFRSVVVPDLFGRLAVFAAPAQPASGPMVTAFDVELLLLAKKRGYRIKEIPITWTYHRTSRVHPFKDGYRMFRQVLQIWAHRRHGGYDPPAA